MLWAIERHFSAQSLQSVSSCICLRHVLLFNVQFGYILSQDCFQLFVFYSFGVIFVKWVRIFAHYFILRSLHLVLKAFWMFFWITSLTEPIQNGHACLRNRGVFFERNFFLLYLLFLQLLLIMLLKKSVVGLLFIRRTALRVIVSWWVLAGLTYLFHYLLVGKSVILSTAWIVWRVLHRYLITLTARVSLHYRLLEESLCIDGVCQHPLLIENRVADNDLLTH